MINLISYKNIILICSIALCSGLNAGSYINEKFEYDNGPLGAPWTFDNLTGGSSVTVVEARRLKGVSPTGKQANFWRPRGGGAILSYLESGMNPDTSAFRVYPGSSAILSVVFSYDAIAANQGFFISVQGGSVAIAGVRLLGSEGGGERSRLQYLTTNSSAIYTSAEGAPLLTHGTWYRLVMKIEVVDIERSRYTLSLTHLSGDEPIFESADIELSSTLHFSPRARIAVGFSAGPPDFSIADINLISK